MKFWDTSAVLPLLVEEAKSESLLSLYQADPALLVWSCTEVECLSGLHRRLRSGQLDHRKLSEALVKFQMVQKSWTTIDELTAVLQKARRIVTAHPLRAADALQLAAAYVACMEEPQGFEFVTLDKNLAAAAIQEGFTVLGLD